jgi:hypothetical protein
MNQEYFPKEFDMENTSKRINITEPQVEGAINHLTADQVKMIDDAISSIGDFGEVRLVIQRGQLHYLVTQKSFNMRKSRTSSSSNRFELRPGQKWLLLLVLPQVSWWMIDVTPKNQLIDHFQNTCQY